MQLGRSEKYIFELGPHIILMLVLTIMTIRKLEENKREYFFCLILGFLCIWMSTKYFPWKFIPNSMIEYPFSMLQFARIFHYLCLCYKYGTCNRRVQF